MTTQPTDISIDDVRAHLKEKAYASRSEWNRKDRKFFPVAKANEWLEDLFPRKSTKKIYTRELVEQIVEKCGHDRSLFNRAYNKAYHFAKEEGFLEEVCPSLATKKALAEKQSALEEAEEVEVEGKAA